MTFLFPDGATRLVLLFLVSAPLRVTQMQEERILFFRRYRAALLDYLLGSGESGLARAYELGRDGICGGTGLLQILGAHQKAVNSILEATPATEERLRQLKACEEFLIEALSSFEMVSRGYVELLDRHHMTSPRQ